MPAPNPNPGGTPPKDIRADLAGKSLADLQAKRDEVSNLATQFMNEAGENWDMRK